MPYLNLDFNYFTNVKTRRLACQLGPGSEMLPIRLWCHSAGHHAEDGVLEGYTVEEIEFFLEWKGARGRAVAALVKVGFLDTLENGFRVHNWMIHEGHISEFKRRSRIANASRWKNPIALAEARSRPSLKKLPEECESGSTSSPDAMNTPPAKIHSGDHRKSARNSFRWNKDSIHSTFRRNKDSHKDSFRRNKDSIKDSLRRNKDSIKDSFRRNKDSIRDSVRRNMESPNQTNQHTHNRAFSLYL